LGIDWGQAGSVILSGLVIVFLILIILIAAVELTSRLVKSAEKKTQTSAPAPVKTAPAPVKTASAPVVQAGIEEETVAVISAAVYSCLENAPGVSAPAYAIQSISRASGVRPVWGFAGMRENTRPF
jgi:sodium pump decarboxylase gamma subunit